MKKAGTSGFDDQRKRLREALYEDVKEALYEWFLTIPKPHKQAEILDLFERVNTISLRAC
ncbi:hypothetical protein HPB47_006996 [Ixodes persulcatus]|uniref:Uncharacterized protein n=1 Tax=Ixodes persulcatus TaxID=34615 RepID=A0AC60P8M1_IXOPE|nr:hypothetical protein HPB47_006996 [Ixodes persulcatus]